MQWINQKILYLYQMYYHGKRGLGEMSLNLYGMVKHLKGRKGYLYLKRLDANLQGYEVLKWMADDQKFQGQHLKKVEDQA